MEKETAETATGLLAALKQLDDQIGVLKAAAEGQWSITRVDLRNPVDAEVYTVVDAARPVDAALTQALFGSVLQQVIQKRDDIAGQLAAL